MLQHMIFCTLLAHTMWALPLPIPHADTASHIVIVTPQAQVHLEPALKYEAPSTFIHHLSPLAHLTAPHDETIVYVPASAAAPIIPLDAVAVGGRSTGTILQPASPTPETKQSLQEQITTAIQQGNELIGPSLSAAAEQAGAAAATAGQNLFPALFPTPSNPTPETNKNDEKLKLKLTEIETPANTQPLIATEARRFYSIAPVVPHVVDIVHAPVYLSPVAAIRARSIESTDNAITLPLKIDEKADAGPLKNALKTDEAELKPEKKQEFARYLEDNVQPAQLPENLKSDIIAGDQEPAATNIIAAAEQPAAIAAAAPALAQPIAL